MAIFLGLFLISNLLLAQNPEPVYRRYTVDDGLPSSMVYHAFQDSKGYIWFATANGVSRFDGYRFENFDLQSGLVDNDVFEIYEDYKHRIWFIPMSGKLCYFEDGRIIGFKYNHKIKDHLPISRGPVKCSFYVDSLDYVYISLKQFGLIRISPEGLVKKYDDIDGDVNISATELPNGKILISCPNGSKSREINIKGLNQSFNSPLKELGIDIGVIHHHLFFQSTHDSSIIFSIFSNVYKVNKGKIIDTRVVHPDVIWLSVDKENNLWLSPINGGIQCFRNADISKDPYRVLLRSYQVSSVLKDREDAYWFTTLNDGVFYCTDLDFINYTKENGLADNRVSAIAVSNDGIYLGYKQGFVDRIRGEEIHHFNVDEFTVKTASVHNIFIDSTDNLVWISAVDNLYWIKNGIVNRVGFYSRTDFHPRKFLRSLYGGYWVAATRGMAKCNKFKVGYLNNNKNSFNGIVYDIVEDKGGVVWFCSISGLWRYYNGNYQSLGDENPIFAQTSYSLFLNPIDSSLWIGTNGSGIVIKGRNRIYQITKKDGLISNSVNQLFYTKHNIWVATKQGLSRINLKDGIFDIENFTTANGLPTNEVTSVCEYKDMVYVGTPKGLTVFNKDMVSEGTTPPSIIISRLRVNNNQINMLQGEMDFSYRQNSLNIDFVGFVFRDAGKANYRYRMLGIDTAWVYTQTPNCLYNGLSNGHYVFEVDAQSYYGIWSSAPASISFTIHPPFWKTTWFLILVVIVFTCVIYFVYKVRINAVHRRNDLLQNINLYKQQSLRQQMNPHFIFNTLNSIQLYILEKDAISSHKYLTKFARLMRMTLDNSLFSTIPLRDELEALRLYLDLEKLRFEDSFEYSIDYGGNDEILSNKIPTLLIQPFVENAIWHGISLKQNQKGWVKIVLFESNDFITCIIEDNGVGRKQSEVVKQLRNKDHKSRGAQLTQQRIDLLNHMYKEQFSIYYNDLCNAQGSPLGTRVSIIIPKQINVNVQV